MLDLQIESRTTLLERLAPDFLEQASYYEEWSGVKSKDSCYTFANGRLKVYFSRHEGCIFSGTLWVVVGNSKTKIEFYDDGPWWDLLKSEIERIRENLPTWRANAHEKRRIELEEAARSLEGVI